MFLFACVCMYVPVHSAHVCTDVSVFAHLGLGSHRPEFTELGIKAAAYSGRTPPVGCFRRGGEATRSGWGQSAVNFSSDRKRAEREKKQKNSSFSEEWLALLSGEVGLRSLNDKDATDTLKADDHIKQAQEPKWTRALSLLMKPNWIPMIISKWYPRGAAAAGASVVVLSRQTVVLLRSTAGRKKASLSALKTPLIEIV